MLVYRLGDLGKLKVRLLDEKAIGSLEKCISDCIRKDGLEDYGEISSRSRDIAVEVYSRGFGDLAALYGFLQVKPIAKSFKNIIGYMHGFHDSIRKDHFPLDATLGLIFIGNDIYKRIKIKENLFTERQEWKICSEDDVVRKGRKKSELEKVLKFCYRPFRTELACILSDSIRSFSPTEFGPFRNTSVMKALRRRGIGFVKDAAITGCNNLSALSYLKTDIYKYTLLLPDKDPEKLSFLEEGLESTLKYIESDKSEVTDNHIFNLGNYLQDLFVVKYFQQKQLDLDFLQKFHDIHKSIVFGLDKGTYKFGDAEIVMHILNTQFSRLNSFFSNVLDQNDFEIVHAYCSEKGISFKSLYSQFNAFAINRVSKRYRIQYERILEFKGI